MKPYPITVSAFRAVLAVCLVWIGFSGCGAPDESVQSTVSELVADTPFRNLSDDIAFVGDDACFDCHESEYSGYKEHGMANSLFLLSRDRQIEEIDGTVVFDSTAGYRYTIFEEDGKYFQEEFRLDADGKKTHSQVREMQYVMGSGISARSYLTLNNGWFYELPISWYTQENKWDFSPGYRVGNKRFDRLIVTRCLTCHDAYPTEVPFTEGKYEHIPLGISCERCHGPGELHVAERLSIPTPDTVDTSIINPAHLTLERRLDVCQQCHMTTTVSNLRNGRTPFDFRPSQDLSEYLSMYALEEPSSNEVIGITSHVGRMKASACFRGSLATNRPMDCATCHDPHSSFRSSGPEYFNNTCQTCHENNALKQKLAASQALPDHEAVSNCISCHMPKADISKVPHSDFTDHQVRVVDREAERVTAPISEPPKLLPIFAEDQNDSVYEGLAYLVHGTRNMDTYYMEKGVELLEEALSLDSEFDEAIFQLGLGYHRLGRLEAAIPWIEQAVSVNPNLPDRLNALAQVYEESQRDPVRIERLYERVLSIQPARADYRVNYGRFLESRGRTDEAVAEYRKAILEQQWFVTAHYNLGTALLRLNETSAAEESLKDALELDPLNPEAWGNLGILYAGREDADNALTAFQKAVEVSPNHPVALANLGARYLQDDDLDSAIPLLSRAASIQPEYVDARVNLALAYFRNDQMALARQEAEAVLQLAPTNALARQILDAI